MEIPQKINLAAAKVAKESNTIVILDLGGKDELMDRNILPYLDYISPNETELLKIFGHDFKDHDHPDHPI